MTTQEHTNRFFVLALYYWWQGDEAFAQQLLEAAAKTKDCAIVGEA